MKTLTLLLFTPSVGQIIALLVIVAIVVAFFVVRSQRGSGSSQPSIAPKAKATPGNTIESIDQRRDRRAS